MEVLLKRAASIAMICFALLIAGCGGSDSSESKLSLGGLKLGSNIENMHSVLGQEASSRVDEDGNTRYKYEDIEVVAKDGVIVGLISYTNKVKTEKGLNQGANLQEVQKAYGKDYVMTDLGEMMLYEYPYDSGKDNGSVMRFAVANDIVDYISLRKVDDDEKATLMTSVKKDDTTNNSTNSSKESKPTTSLASLEDDNNKAAIREYLEHVNPFFITGFYKFTCGIIGPLANADEKSLRDYAWVMSMASQGSSNVPKGAEKVDKFVRDYFVAEARIASGYYKIKKDGNGIIATLTGFANTGIGYSEQSKAEEEIQKLIDWSGAKVYTSFVEAAAKGFVDLFKGSNRTPANKSSNQTESYHLTNSSNSSSSNASNASNTTQPLGSHWIKDINNGAYLWNPEPSEGETVSWSGGYVQEGGYRYADGSGTLTWRKDGKVIQTDEGTFERGRHHGQFKHTFPSGRTSYSNWSHGQDITDSGSNSDDINAASQAFANYHRAITNQNYREAYDTLSSAQKERVGDFDSYAAGYVDTISSEVSNMRLVSSDSDSCTFDYTLTARDRYQGNRVKVQTFDGQVTMAKDGGKWYVRSARSSKTGERIE